MKKTTIVYLVALFIGCLSACHKVEYGGQTGKILHKKYDPALNISYSYADSVQSWDTLYIDLDQDKTTDLKVYFEYDIPFIQAMKDWQICIMLCLAPTNPLRRKHGTCRLPPGWQ